MGKSSNRKHSRTSSSRTAPDVAATNSMISSQMAQNPMHTREQGERSFMNLMGSMMGNIDSFVDKMDAKVAGVMGSNPAMDVFNQQAAANGTPVQQPAPAPQQQAPIAPPPPVEPQPQPVPVEPQAPEMPVWMKRLPPETQAALMKWESMARERQNRRDARRERFGIMQYQPERFEL